MKLILGWIVLTLAVAVSIAVLPGMKVDWTGGVFAAIAAGFAVLNVVLAWVLTALSVPLKVTTWGSVALVLNTAVFLVTDEVMGSLEIDGLGPALLGAAVVSFTDLVIEGVSRSFRSGLARTSRQRPIGGF